MIPLSLATLLVGAPSVASVHPWWPTEFELPFEGLPAQVSGTHLEWMINGSMRDLGFDSLAERDLPPPGQTRLLTRLRTDETGQIRNADTIWLQRLGTSSRRTLHLNELGSASGRLVRIEEGFDNGLAIPDSKRIELTRTYQANSLGFAYRRIPGNRSDRWILEPIPGVWATPLDSIPRNPAWLEAFYTDSGERRNWASGGSIDSLRQEYRRGPQEGVQILREDVWISNPSPGYSYCETTVAMPCHWMEETTTINGLVSRGLLVRDNAGGQQDSSEERHGWINDSEWIDTRWDRGEPTWRDTTRVSHDAFGHVVRLSRGSSWKLLDYDSLHRCIRERVFQNGVLEREALRSWDGRGRHLRIRRAEFDSIVEGADWDPEDHLISRFLLRQYSDTVPTINGFMDSSRWENGHRTELARFACDRQGCHIQSRTEFRYMLLDAAATSTGPARSTIHLDMSGRTLRWNAPLPDGAVVVLHTLHGRRLDAATFHGGQAEARRPPAAGLLLWTVEIDGHRLGSGTIAP